MTNESLDTYKMSLENMVLAKLAEGPLETDYGRFNMAVYHDGHEQAVVLTKGELKGQRDVLCRIHSECISAHVFYGHVCDCREQMMKSQKLIRDEGRGLIIYLTHEGRGNGAAAHTATLTLKENGMPQPEAYERCGFPEDRRTFDIAAKIIRTLEIESITLISSNKKKINTLVRFGVTVAGTHNLDAGFIPMGRSKNNVEAYIKQKKHKPIVETDGDNDWIMVIGDLAVDVFLSEREFIEGNRNVTELEMGGTAYNAAKELNKTSIKPIVVGKIGDDAEGKFIREELEKQPFPCLVEVAADKKPSGAYKVLFTANGNRVPFPTSGVYNANDYDLNLIQQAMTISGIDKNHLVFLVAHSFVRFNKEHNKKLIEIITASDATLVLDLVPHNMYEKLALDDLIEIMGDKVTVLISEYKTLMHFLGRPVRNEPGDDDKKAVLEHFKAKFIVIRYGDGEISIQDVYKRIGDNFFEKLESLDTGYLDLTDQQKKGFGDTLTAQFLEKYKKDIFNV